MIKNDKFINSLARKDITEYVASVNGVDLSEARKIVSGMSFIEYTRLEEASADIIPPSGQKISTAPTKQSQPAASAPVTTQPQQAVPVGQPNSKGQIQVKNPVTNKLEWMMPVQGSSAPTTPPQVAEDEDIARMRKLAGIKETCSAGATGAGSIAVAPSTVGKLNKREYTNEQHPVEYKKTEPAKTIVGDTKPSQASGELSANLAARGKKTASRKNNGLRR